MKIGKTGEKRKNCKRKGGENPGGNRRTWRNKKREQKSNFEKRKKEKNWIPQSFAIHRWNTKSILRVDKSTWKLLCQPKFPLYNSLMVTCNHIPNHWFWAKWDSLCLGFCSTLSYQKTERNNEVGHGMHLKMDISMTFKNEGKKRKKNR